MRYKKLTVMVLGITFVSGLLLTGCGGEKTLSESTVSSQQETEQMEQTEKEETQPPVPELGNFEARTLDGGTFTQEDLARKDATLINFWATYCGPCLAEMPDIAKLEKALPDNVQIITVCLDGETEMARKILEDAGYEGVTLISGDGDLSNLVGEILYIPTTIVVDQAGNKIGDEIIGGQKNLEEVFVGALNQALKSAGKTEIEYAEE